MYIILKSKISIVNIRKYVYVYCVQQCHLHQSRVRNELVIDHRKIKNSILIIQPIITYLFSKKYKI